MPEPASPLRSSRLQGPKRTQSTMNGAQAVHGKAERWGTWSHPKRPRKQIIPSSPQTPSPGHRGAVSALQQVFAVPGDSPEVPAISIKKRFQEEELQQPALQPYQQLRQQQKSASAPRPRTRGRAPIPQFRTYSHTQSSAAKSRAAAAPEPEDEDAVHTARIHAWLDRVVDELVAAEAETEARAGAEVETKVQVDRARVEAEVAEPREVKADEEEDEDEIIEVEVPTCSASRSGHPSLGEQKAPVVSVKTPARRLAVETDLQRADSGWGTASPASINMALMTPRTVPPVREDAVVWELLSPNVTPFRKGKGPKRTRRRSYYDEDIWPSACSSPQSLVPPVQQVQALS